MNSSITPDLPPVHVIHLITRLIVGGAQENTIYTAALLDKTRYQVEIISGPQTGSEGSLIEETRLQQIPLIILPELRREISPLNDFKAFFKIIRILRQKNCAILHTHSSKAGILGRLAGRAAGVPILVHTVHGWSFHDYMSSIVRNIYILLERWTARFTDALVVVTRQDIEKGLHAGIGKPEQYRLIRSAIPLETFNSRANDRLGARQRLGISLDAIVIGNVGRFSPQKNPLDWARVAGIVGRQNPKVHFLLTGDGPLRGELETQLEREGIAGRTTLTGLRRDIPQMMAAMDIFLLTSLWEGLPARHPTSHGNGLTGLS